MKSIKSHIKFFDWFEKYDQPENIRIEKDSKNQKDHNKCNCLGTKIQVYWEKDKGRVIKYLCPHLQKDSSSKTEHLTTNENNTKNITNQESETTTHSKDLSEQTNNLENTLESYTKAQQSIKNLEYLGKQI